MTNREYHDQQRKEKREREAYLMTIPEYAYLKKTLDSYMMMSGRRDERFDGDAFLGKFISFLLGGIFFLGIAIIFFR